MRRCFLTFGFLSVCMLGCAIGSHGGGSSDGPADAGPAAGPRGDGSSDDPNRLVLIAITIGGYRQTKVVLPLGQTVAMGLTARSASGATVPVNAAAVRWEISNNTLALQTSNDGFKKLTASTDWFDMPEPRSVEPTATVTAYYGTLTATLVTTNVINVIGDWTATLDIGKKQELSLSQSERTIIDARTGYAGVIDGDALTITFGGASLSAKFTSRVHAFGVYDGFGASGTFVCDRNM